jgi:hypothetical protein
MFTHRHDPQPCNADWIGDALRCRGKVMDP